jgi:hypothetical protein
MSDTRLVSQVINVLFSEQDNINRVIDFTSIQCKSDNSINRLLQKILDEEFHYFDSMQLGGAGVAAGAGGHLKSFFKLN